MKAPIIIPGIDSYFGGKAGSGTPHAIINQIPPFSRYIEPCLGGGSIFRHLAFEVGDMVELSDVNRELIYMWQTWNETDWSSRPFGIEIQVRDVFDVIRDLLFDQHLDTNTFLFLDPPYRKDSRKSQRDVYRHQFSEGDHKHLLQGVQMLKCNCMITHYPDPVYDAALSLWRKVDFKITTRQGQVIDRMYMNYAEPTRLKDYTYLGETYRDRENLKDKIERWQNKLANLGKYERQAVFNALTETFNQHNAL